MKKGIIIATVIMLLGIIAFVLISRPKQEVINGEYQVFRSKEGKNEMMSFYQKALSHWPVACQESDLPTTYGKTHVITAGANNARPMVLLHGMSCNSAINWAMMIKELSKNHRVYAIDTIGDLGKSRPVRLPRSSREYADWLNEVLTALKVDRASFVGASYGGFLVHSVLQYYPVRVEKAVLLEYSYVKSIGIATLARMIYYSLSYEKDNIRTTVEWYNGGPVKDPEWKKIAENIFYMATRYGNPHGIMPGNIPQSVIQGLKAPVMIIVGEKDVIYNAQEAREYCKKLNPAIRFETVAGMGHLIAPDKQDYINAKIVDFIK